MTERKEILVTPNSIARGSYNIGEKENNLFLKLMYSVQKLNSNYMIARKKSEELNAEELAKWQELCKIETLEARITRADLLEIFKNKNDRTPDGMDAIFKALRECEIRFETVTREGVRAKLVATLINHYYIEEETGDYLVIVPAKLYRYLFDLGLGHSQNALQVIYSLGGLYSRRLYLIFRSWTGTKNDIEFTVEELRDMLQLGSKNKTYNSFETNVLKRAIDEINRSKAMTIKIKEKIKKGRSVHSVIFTVQDNEPRNYLKDFEKIGLPAPATRPVPPAPVIKEPIVWLDYIKLESEELIERLERRYGGDYDFNSPFIKACFARAYDNTIRHDETFDRIQDKKGATNWALFNKIVGDELFTYEQGMINSVNTETSVEAELYEPIDTGFDDFSGLKSFLLNRGNEEE